MIHFSDKLSVLIHRDPVDLRKAINGLMSIVVASLECDPMANCLYIFHNRNRDKIKGLLWDKNGFVLVHKRLERGKFVFRYDFDTDRYEVEIEALNWLLAGFDFYRLQEYPDLKKHYHYY